MASSLTHYRQEWAYANHCSVAADSIKHEAKADLPPASEDYALLHQVIGLLDGSNKSLLDQLFWKEESEATLGQRHGLSQQAISKRKHAVIRRLRDLLE
jgi:DNA-directed RNA polymerase specialized sigma subunit